MEKVHVDFKLSTKKPVAKEKASSLEEYVDAVGEEVGLELRQTKTRRVYETNNG